MRKRKPKLKPCPFCGLPPSFVGFGDWALIECITSSCFCASAGWGARRQVVRRWNRRNGASE